MIKSFSMKSLPVLAAAFALVMGVSCTPEVQNVTPESVSINETGLYLFQGQTQQLKATVLPLTANNKKVSWSIDNSSVATIADDGTVTAVAEGDAVITVTTAEGAKTATCEVTVAKPMVAVTGVALDPKTLALFVGETAELNAAVVPANATVQDVTWTTTDENIVTVADGIIVAKSVGTAIVTVTTAEGAKTASCAVTVDANSFTVSFVTNGDSEIAPVTVKKGEALPRPSDPTKAGGLDAGLYEGMVDPDSGASVFAGWYMDADCTLPYAFGTPVTYDFTLYGKWETAVTPINVPVPAAGDKGISSNACIYLNGLTLSEPTTYTLVVTEGNKWQNLMEINNANVTLYIIGRGEPRVLGHTWSENLLFVEKGNVFLGKNITITSTGGSWAAPISIGTNGTAHVTMLEGSKVEGCTTTWRGIIFVNDGGSSFTLDGGEICNNTVNATSEKLVGTIVVNWGNVYIKKGKIHDNVAIAQNPDAIPSGGVMIPHDRQCEKTGGEIYDNKASFADGVAGKFSGNNMLVGTPSNLGQGVFVINENIGESVTFKTDTLKNSTPDASSIWKRLN